MCLANSCPSWLSRRAGPAALHKFRSHHPNYKERFCCPMTNRGETKNICTQSAWRSCRTACTAANAALITDSAHRRFVDSKPANLLCRRRRRAELKSRFFGLRMETISGFRRLLPSSTRSNQRFYILADAAVGPDAVTTVGTPARVSRERRAPGCQRGSDVRRRRASAASRRTSLITRTVETHDLTHK